MMNRTSISASGSLLVGFLFVTSNIFGQLPAPTKIGDPLQPSKTPIEQAKDDVAKAQENLRKIEADNQATSKKIADYITKLQKAARGIIDKDTKEILEQSRRNQNLRAIIDHLRKYPGDLDFVNLLRQEILDNPTQDPAQKLDGMLKGYKDPGVPPDVQKRRQQLLERLGSELRRTMLEITAKGTGRTTGHIANISVTNPTQSYLVISPQSVFIPSDGQYQPYVGMIPGTLIPPGTTTIPVDGYCADVHTPPVPEGNPMPPLEDWIPVGDQEDVSSGDDFPIISTTPVPTFDPESIPDIMESPGYTTTPPSPEEGLIVTWPGTDIPVGGILDPDEDPTMYAPVIVKVMEEVIAAAESITESGILTTPFSSDPPRQIEAFVQQQVWIFTASITGSDYGKTDFTTKVYDQYEDNSGKSVTTLPEEHKEKLDSGIDDFWNAFTAVGVEAKVISATSPGIDLDPSVLAIVSADKCECEDISYDLVVSREGFVVHDDSHTSRKSPKVAISDFKYGDSLDIKIKNIKANCACEAVACLFYPAESTNKGSPNYGKTDLTKPGQVDIEISDDGADVISQNNNVKMSNEAFNDTRKEFSFGLKTRDEKSFEKSVFQRLRIKAYCELADCKQGLCAKYIQLNFVTAN